MNMVSNSLNPYWGRAIQYQQQKPQASQRPGQEPRPRDGHRVRHTKDDFGGEWLNKDVEIECVRGTNATIFRARVVDVSKYWLKVIVNDQILYLNKAYVLSIRPAEIERGASGGDHAGGK
jgi:hypothetical protein